jgi:hypothetical protein
MALRQKRGKWKVIAGAAEDQAAALKIYDEARDAGFPARIRLTAAADGGRYEVVLGWLCLAPPKPKWRQPASRRPPSSSRGSRAKDACSKPQSAQLRWRRRLRADSTSFQPRALSAEASCIACIDRAQARDWARAQGRQPKEAASARRDSSATRLKRRSTASLK